MGLFLFYTSTRAAWLAVTVEFLFLGILLARDHFKWQLAPSMGADKKKAAAICALVVFILINLTPSGFQWQIGTAYHRIREVLPGFTVPIGSGFRQRWTETVLKKNLLSPTRSRLQNHLGTV